MSDKDWQPKGPVRLPAEGEQLVICSDPATGAERCYYGPAVRCLDCGSEGWRASSVDVLDGLELATPEAVEAALVHIAWAGEDGSVLAWCLWCDWIEGPAVAGSVAA